jgi:hypothetical protein
MIAARASLRARLSSAATRGLPAALVQISQQPNVSSSTASAPMATMSGLSTAAWGTVLPLTAGAVTTHTMRSFHRGPRFLRSAFIGPFAAVCVMVVVASCSRPPSYTIVELGESMTIKEEAVLDARSLHPPGDLGAEEWVVPSASVVLSGDRFVVAAMQPFGVVLYDLAAATSRLVTLAFGQGPQELEEIDDLLVCEIGRAHV